jgi:TRAP-type transport system periplasmic protein
MMKTSNATNKSRRVVLKAGGAFLATGLVAAPTIGRGQTKYSFKLSVFAPPSNGSTRELQLWADELRKDTNGELDILLFPSSQMGPPARQFELVRSGVADLAWVLHGFTPGRFPLTEIAYLPTMFPDALSGTRALLRALPKYLANEHAGTRVLAVTASPRLKILTRNVAIRSVDDLRGRRLRHPAAIIGESLTNLGAVPVAVPPAEMGDAISNGVVDGLVTSYEAAASFKIFDSINHSTDVNVGLATFALAMNGESYKKLPDDLRAKLDARSGSTLSEKLATNFEASEAQAIASTAGKIASVDVVPSERDRFNTAFDRIREAKLSALMARGLPARDVFAELRA